MKIIDFPKPTPERSVSDMLRDLADTFEKEGQPDAMAYVATGSFGLFTGLMGMTDEVHGCGLLTIGSQFMANEACGE